MNISDEAFRKLMEKYFPKKPEPVPPQKAPSFR